MKALTVQQPWAWAIIHGGKDVENRTQLWKHRGPLAIHAGARWSIRGRDSELVRAAANVGTPAEIRRFGPQFPIKAEVGGIILGVVDLVDVHTAEEGCCDSPWAERQYVEHGGRVRRQITHLVLANALAVNPVPMPGKLGLWTVPAGLL